MAEGEAKAAALEAKAVAKARVEAEARAEAAAKGEAEASAAAQAEFVAREGAEAKAAAAEARAESAGQLAAIDAELAAIERAEVSKAPTPAPAPAGAAGGGQRTATVVADFTAEAAGDLSLRAGEVVVLSKAKPNKQWWRGHVDGAPEREGVFPRDAVEEEEEPPPYEGRAPLADAEVSADAGPTLQLELPSASPLCPPPAAPSGVRQPRVSMGEFEACRKALRAAVLSRDTGAPPTPTLAPAGAGPPPVAAWAAESEGAGSPLPEAKGEPAVYQAEPSPLARPVGSPGNL